MKRMEQKDDYYLPDEERFGFITSHFYNLFSAVSPMKKFYGNVLDTVLSKDPNTVLDVGFGTGNVIKLMAQKKRKLSIFGVEPSPHMFKVASRKLKKFINSGNLKFSLGSSRDIPFEEKFDVIYSSLSFHHWKNQEESIANILKHLNPGGKFIVFEYGQELLRGYKRTSGGHSLSMEQIEKFRNKFDFEVIDTGEFRRVEFTHSDPDKP